MPTARPFAYNTGSTLSNTVQYGDIAVLTGDTLPSGVDWWNGPDEDLGYVIATENSSGNQPNPLSVPAYLNFFRTNSPSDEFFITLANYVTGQNFTTALQASNYLLTNGYWTSFKLRSISAGANFSLYSTNGVVYGWGGNGSGQLGINTTGNRSTPVAVCGGLTFSQISAGDFAGNSFALGITTSGIAYSWGDDTYGQLGISGDADPRSTPVAVCGGLTFSQVSAGGTHSLGLTTTGIVYAWGNNLDQSFSPCGQLGDNTSVGKFTPVAVCGGLTFSQVSAGEYFSLGITTTGIAYGWGDNTGGQLGDNTIVDKSTPIAVCGGLTFSQISAGNNHSLGLTTTGIVYGWGANNTGALGDNTIVSKITPIAICGGLTFSQISAGNQHSLGITAGGIAYAWGNNSSGQLGDSTLVSRLTPVAVCGGLTFSQVVAGTSYSLGITRLGVVYAWGTNFSGQIGVNKPLSVSSPISVVGGLNFCQISAGYGSLVTQGFSLGVTTNGVAYAWGIGTGGVKGDNITECRITPVAVCGGLIFSQISTGRDHTLGITTSGIAYAWGTNGVGQLGDDTITAKCTPIAVCGGLTFSQISAGNQFSLGITTTGVAYGWGTNATGQLGDNTIVSKRTPVAVCGGLTFSQLSAGRGSSGFSLGITTTGIAYAWGVNTNGQLGDNSITSRITPVAVCGGLTFSQISAGGSHSLGITTTGIAYAWGLNTNGQLGDNSITSRITPVEVCGGLTFSQISAGDSYCLGITTTGVAYGWGLNTNGQLGDNTTVSKRTPIAVCGGLTFSRISAGGGHSLGITTTGEAYAWGVNGSGQLGDGANYFVTPTAVCNL